MKTKRILTAVLLIGAVTIMSCSKDDDDNVTTTTATGGGSTSTTGTLMMHLHSSWGNMSTDFQLDSTYTLTSTVGGVVDRQIKFSSAKFYISKIALDNDTLQDTYLLVSPDAMMYSGGNFEAGSFSNLYFNVGVDATANHADPTTAASPLDQTDMHWNWNTSAGYKFIKLEGQIDTSATGTGNEWKSFTYHVATDAMLRNISIVQSTTITANQSTSVNYHVMWNKFFDGIDVATNSSGHGGTTTNTAIADNAQNVFMAMP